MNASDYDIILLNLYLVDSGVRPGTLWTKNQIDMFEAEAKDKKDKEALTLLRSLNKDTFKYRTIDLTLITNPTFETENVSKLKNSTDTKIQDVLLGKALGYYCPRPLGAIKDAVDFQFLYLDDPSSPFSRKQLFSMKCPTDDHLESYIKQYHQQCNQVKSLLKKIGRKGQLGCEIDYLLQ